MEVYSEVQKMDSTDIFTISVVNVSILMEVIEDLRHSSWQCICQCT